MRFSSTSIYKHLYHFLNFLVSFFSLKLTGPCHSKQKKKYIERDPSNERKDTEFETIYDIWIGENTVLKTMITE